MKVKALVSFSGAFSMYEGEVRECSDDSTLQDLLRIKYIEEVKEEAIPKQTKGKSTQKPKKDVKSKNDSKPDNK